MHSEHLHGGILPFHYSITCSQTRAPPPQTTTSACDGCMRRVEVVCTGTSLPLLKQLHWLPVNYRIKFKLSTLTYRALAIHQPPYLASLLHFSNVPRQLRSSTSQQLSIPRTKLNLGKRAFSVAAPIIWNELPTTLKSCESLASFRKNLKTYLFKIAFPP